MIFVFDFRAPRLGVRIAWGPEMQCREQRPELRELLQGRPFHPRAFLLNEDTFDHDKGQKSAISGNCLHYVFGRCTEQALDGRNRAIVIAESLARVIAAIRIASVRWRSYLPRNTEMGPHRPCVRCAAIRIARLAFIRLTSVPRGTAEWLARVDRVR